LKYAYTFPIVLLNEYCNTANYKEHASVSWTWSCCWHPGQLVKFQTLKLWVTLIQKQLWGNCWKDVHVH